MLTLTSDGLLPVGIHECHAEDIYTCFVEPFSSWHRQHLFTAWQGYCVDLKAFVSGTPCMQWINGSFVTEKPIPNDIDFVTFLPYQVYEPIVEQLIERYSTFSLYDTGLDAYICPVYPPDHSQYDLYLERKQYWQKTFGSQRNDLTQKGFLQLWL